MVNNIIIVPFYVKRGGAHSLNTLTFATVAIEDKWPAGWQNHWSEVITIITTAILDGSVMTIAAIWYFTPFFILVEKIVIIPVDASGLKSTWTVGILSLSDAVASFRPWNGKEVIFRCLDTVPEYDMIAIDRNCHLGLNPWTFFIFIPKSILCILDCVSTLPPCWAAPC